MPNFLARRPLLPPSESSRLTPLLIFHFSRITTRSIAKSNRYLMSLKAESASSRPLSSLFRVIGLLRPVNTLNDINTRSPDYLLEGI